MILTKAQFNKIARCDCKEVNTANLHTNTGFRKGVHCMSIGGISASRGISTGSVPTMKLDKMEVEHEPPGLYAGVAKLRLAC